MKGLIIKQKRTKELIEKISQTLSKIRGDWQHLDIVCSL